MTNSNIKVSVITPVYNDEKWIFLTLQSILNQTHSNIEILVVDDCSTDNTIKIVESFNDSRIKIFRNESNMGAAFSRNVGLKNASGEYIAFLDADDLWNKDKIEKQLHFMISRNVDFSCTFYKEINEDGVENGVCVKAPKKITHKKLMRVNYIGCLTVMYKRSIFPNLEIPSSISKRNDYALWLKLSEKANCYTLEECLSFYRVRRSSISSGKKSQLIKYHEKMFSELYGMNPFLANFLALRNALYYTFRKKCYRKKQNM